MEIRTGDLACRADKRDLFPGIDLLPFFYIDLAAMGVHRRVAVLVLYAEKLAARAVLADFRHRSGRKADDIVAGVCREIHAVVELCLVVDRVQPVAEIGGYSGGKRLNEGELRHGRIVGDIGRNAEIDERLLLFHKRRHRLFNGGGQLFRAGWFRKSEKLRGVDRDRDRHRSIVRRFRHTCDGFLRLIVCSVERFFDRTDRFGCAGREEQLRGGRRNKQSRCHIDGCAFCTFHSKSHSCQSIFGRVTSYEFFFVA